MRMLSFSYLILLTAISLSFKEIDVYAQEVAFKAEDWQKDLRVLEKELITRHINPFRKVSKDRFHQRIDQLHAQIPQLNQNQILIEFAKIFALIGDGHTNFDPAGQRGMEFRSLPLQFWQFEDGIHVITATQDQRALLGKRLTHIGKTTISEAFQKITETIGADNRYEFDYTVPFAMGSPELLHGLKIVDDPSKVELTFDDGTKTTIESSKEEKSDRPKWFCANSIFKDEEIPSRILNFLFATDFILPHLMKREYYWYEMVPNQEAMFLQYNICWNQEERPSFKQVVDNMFVEMDQNGTKRLIIDLRQNSGGEPLTAAPLIEELKKRESFCKEGRVFVLVGRRTFSAALTNAVHLRSMCNAKIVGEPSRGKPNNPSEGRDIKLPDTNTIGTVSTQMVVRDEKLGESESLPIDITVPLRFDSYRRAIDDTLSAAISAKIQTNQK